MGCGGGGSSGKELGRQLFLVIVIGVQKKCPPTHLFRKYTRMMQAISEEIDSLCLPYISYPDEHTHSVIVLYIFLLISQPVIPIPHYGWKSNCFRCLDGSYSQ